MAHKKGVGSSKNGRASVNMTVSLTEKVEEVLKS